jgi:hypothetical protein
VLLRRSDASCTTDDASAENPVDGHLLRVRWLKSSSRVRVSGFCNVHPASLATLQSVQHKTFHCSSECLVAAWKAQRSRAALANGASAGALANECVRAALRLDHRPAGRAGARDNGKELADAPSLKSQVSGPQFAGATESWTEARRLAAPAGPRRLHCSPHAAWHPSPPRRPARGTVAPPRAPAS